MEEQAQQDSFSYPSFAPQQSRFGGMLDSLENHRVLTLCGIGFIILLEIVWGVSSFQGSAASQTTSQTQTKVSSGAPKSTTIAGIAENRPLPAGVSLTMQADQVSVAVGKPLTASITLSTASQNTDGTTAVILYDPNVLQYQKVVNGTLYPTYIKPVVDETAGKITITGITDVQSFYKGTGVFAKVLFTAKARGTASLGFDFAKGNSKASAVAADKQDILTTALGTSVKVE